jgi:transposase
LIVIAREDRRLLMERRVSDEFDGDVSSHTTSPMTGRIEVVSRVSGRRYWTVEQKLRILRDAFGPGGSRQGAMERHEVTSGQLYTWRNQAMTGELAGVRRAPVIEVSPSMPVVGADFAEVQFADAVPPALPAPTQPEAGGRIGIELPSGVKLTVDGGVDAEALARVLGVLSR